VGGDQGAERFSARLNEADAMFTTVSDASGVPYAGAAITIQSHDHGDDRLRAYFREREARLLPAMRRRIAWDRFSIALPRWVECPGFDPSDNIVFVDPPGDGSIRAILDWGARWAAQPLPPDRPPWRRAIFRGVEIDGVPGRVVMLIQQHHSIIDGEGARRMDARHFKPIPDDGTLPELPPPVPYDTSTPFERWKEGWALEGVKAREALRNTGARLRWAAANPRAGARRTRELAGAVRRMQRQQSTQTRSPLLRRRSDELRFDWLTFELPAIKAGAKAVGGSLNDGFMAAVALGLHAYHLDHGIRLDSVRTAMAVNRRTDDSYKGNVVSAIIIDLPLGDDPTQAVKACHDLVRAHLEDRDLLWLIDRGRAIANRLPRRLMLPLTRKGTAGYDMQISNIFGPPRRASSTGVQTLGSCGLPMGPSALTLALVSSSDIADLGITTDRASIPDPENLTARLEQGFQAIIDLAR
jgi:WS/DGAT/MGAT family acyltransferase